ncbi:Protein CBG19859 [Caenorhabditis briggsae]|uniref:Protein CBG19859 n=1 Tax=Caenorhabditis briggsae TaxID=6238 RepID=A8XWL6_CAEBR|nr:Protein CBG19859 [Caenorhabditis briggsae]CAP37035.2 Protein CBG19859 [Caenorhabditis briggsae]
MVKNGNGTIILHYYTTDMDLKKKIGRNPKRPRLKNWIVNVIYDGNEITGEPDHENGNDRACFKPGPDHPIDQQMLFLKQCMKKVDTRPPNMYYLTNGWSVDNFEALFKYMIRTSEDCSRDTLLSIERCRRFSSMAATEEEVPLQLSYHVNALTGETLVDCDVENDETDVTSDSTQDNGMHEFVEMFPVLLELFEKAGITDDVVKNEDDHEVDTEMPVLNSRFPRCNCRSSRV